MLKEKTIAQKNRENDGVDKKSVYITYEWPLSNHQSFSNLDPSLPSRQSLASHSRTENAHPAIRSHSQSLTKDITGSSSHFEMTLLPDPASVSVRKIDRGEFMENCQSSSISVSGFANGTVSNVRHHSVSDSMFSSAELSSRGHEEYNDEPRSWRRSRRSEESFI